MPDAFVAVDHVDLAYDEASGNAIEDVSLAIEEYLAGRRWSDLHAFLSDLPNVLRA